MELREDMLLQIAFFRVIRHDRLDEPQRKLLVHVVRIQLRRTDERAVLLHDSLDAPQMVFHDGVSLRNGEIVFHGLSPSYLGRQTPPCVFCQADAFFCSLRFCLARSASNIGAGM